MSNTFSLPIATALDSSANVINGAKLNFYTTGTSNRLDTYSDAALSSANANPVVADSAGRFGAIFLKDAVYKVVLTDAADVEIWTFDPVNPQTRVVGDTTPQAGGPFSMNSFQMNFSKGADVASPAGGALTLGTDGNYFDITGTNAITSIGTLGIGTVVAIWLFARSVVAWPWFVPIGTAVTVVVGWGLGRGRGPQPGTRMEESV